MWRTACACSLRLSRSRSLSPYEYIFIPFVCIYFGVFIHFHFHLWRVSMERHVIRSFLTWHFARITELLPDRIPLEIGIVKHAISIKRNEYEAFSHIDSLNIFSSNLYTYWVCECAQYTVVSSTPNPFIGWNYSSSTITIGSDSFNE